jgi:hypothetical protein
MVALDMTMDTGNGRAKPDKRFGTFLKKLLRYPGASVLENKRGRDPDRMNDRV